MINNTEVDAAVAAATRTLAEDPDLAWIKKSCLLNRAYLSGLYAGLLGIAKDEEHLGRILLRSIAGTIVATSPPTWRTSPGTSHFSKQITEDGRP